MLISLVVLTVGEENMHPSNEVVGNGVIWLYIVAFYGHETRDFFETLLEIRTSCRSDIHDDFDEAVFVFFCDAARKKNT